MDLKDSETIMGWDDLRHYGINYLTGESCSYGMRLLCDVNYMGADVVCGFLGLPHNTGSFSEPWNSKVNGLETVGSIMLPREMFVPLAAFILLGNGYLYVYEYGTGAVVGTMERKSHIRTGKSYCNIATLSKQPSSDGRNVHAMSGRVD